METLVELSTGEVAVVLEQNRARRLKPKVLVISAPDKTPLRIPATLDLLYVFEIIEVGHEISPRQSDS